MYRLEVSAITIGELRAAYSLGESANRGTRGIDVNVFGPPERASED